MFPKPAVNLILRMNENARTFAADEGTEPRGIAIEVITALVSLLPTLLSLCKKPAPTPPPVPASLAAMGVSDGTWKTASDSKWASTEAWHEGRGKFAPQAVNSLARDLRSKDSSLSMKDARVQARAALESGRTEDVETIAVTMHAARS